MGWVLLEYCNKRFPFNLKLSGVDMNDKELKLARIRLLDKDIDFYNAKAQKLNFIKDSSKDVIFCHWALTLMDPVIPVLKTIKRILKKQGVFSAIVDGIPILQMDIQKFMILYTNMFKKYSQIMDY